MKKTSTDHDSDTPASNSSEDDVTSTSRRMVDASFFNQPVTVIPPDQNQAPSSDRARPVPSVSSSSASMGEMLGTPSTPAKANYMPGPVSALPSKVRYRKNGTRSAVVSKTNAFSAYAKSEGPLSFGNVSKMRFSALRSTANLALERTASRDAGEGDTRSAVQPGDGTISRPESRNSQGLVVQNYEGYHNSLFGSSPPPSRQATPTKRSQEAPLAIQSSSKSAQNTHARESQPSVRGPVYAYDVPPSFFNFSLPGTSTTYPGVASSRTSVSARAKPSVKEEGSLSGPSTRLTSGNDRADEGGNADVSDGSYTPKAKSKASKKRKIKTSDGRKRATWKIQDYCSASPHESTVYPHSRKFSFKITRENNSGSTSSPAPELGPQQECVQQANNDPPAIRGDTAASEAAQTNGRQAPIGSQHFEDGYDTFGLYDASDYGTNAQTAADQAGAPFQIDTFRNTQLPPASRNVTGTDQADSASTAKLDPEPSPQFRKETVSIIIEDSRFPDREPSFVELDLPLRQNERGGFWLDAVALCKELQSDPWRIDGPAKAYVFRDKYRQYFLRVSEDNADFYASMRLSVPMSLELRVMVEPQIEARSGHPGTRSRPRPGSIRPSQGSSTSTSVSTSHAGSVGTSRSTATSISCPPSNASFINISSSTPSFP